MKVIAIHRPDNNDLWTFRAELIADSAIGRDVMPLFMPDIGDTSRLTIAPAFRVGRLGKNIPQKFALRYIDAVSAVALLDADGDYHASGLASIIDSRVTAGDWIGFNADVKDFTINVEYAKTEESDSIAINLDDIALTDTIHHLTHNTTIKTGDIIIFTSPAIVTPPRDLTASIGGVKTLNLRIK